MNIYTAVKKAHETMLKDTLGQEFKQTMRVICMLLSYFSREFADLGESMPWFNLLNLVHGREWIGRWVPLRPVLTSADMASITQMLLGVDTTHLSKSSLLKGLHP